MGNHEKNIQYDIYKDTEGVPKAVTKETKKDSNSFWSSAGRSKQTCGKHFYFTMQYINHSLDHPMAMGKKLFKIGRIANVRLLFPLVPRIIALCCSNSNVLERKLVYIATRFRLKFPRIYPYWRTKLETFR